MRQGCLKPLLISAGLLVLLGLALVVAYRDTFSLMLTNAQAMGEGAEVARALRSPEDVLSFIAAHPERVSLVAFDRRDEAEGIFYGPDAMRPVTGLPRLLALAEYRRQVEAGALDPQTSVPLDALEAYFLPGTDPSAHGRMMAALRGQSDREHTTLAQIAEAMMRWNAGAATDLLLERLGRPALAALPGRLGLPTLAPPLPSSGLYLSWNNHTQTSAPEDRLAAIEHTPPDVYAADVHRLTATHQSDSAFRRRERERLTTSGTDLSLPQQRALAQHTFPHGTARTYATLLDRLLAGSLLTPDVGQAMRPYLERALPDSMGTSLEVIGSEAGSFPGLLSFAGYAVRDDLPEGRVAVLLVEDLPISVFYHLLQTGLDRGFLLQLLGDDAFFERTRRRLSAAQ